MICKSKAKIIKKKELNRSGNALRHTGIKSIKKAAPNPAPPLHQQKGWEKWRQEQRNHFFMRQMEF